jgi:hypothetical protein
VRDRSETSHERGRSRTNLLLTPRAETGPDAQWWCRGTKRAGTQRRLLLPRQPQSRSLEGTSPTPSSSCAATAAERAREEQDIAQGAAAPIAALGRGHGASAPRHAVMATPATPAAWPLSRGARKNYHGSGSALPRRCASRLGREDRAATRRCQIGQHRAANAGDGSPHPRATKPVIITLPLFGRSGCRHIG